MARAGVRFKKTISRPMSSCLPAGGSGSIAKFMIAQGAETIQHDIVGVQI